jgi:hypothetical protein
MGLIKQLGRLIRECLAKQTEVSFSQIDRTARHDPAILSRAEYRLQCDSGVSPASFGAMEKLFEFCSALDGLHVRYGVLVARDDAVMVTVVIPGQYVEIEFFSDGSVEVERFLSRGVEEASDADLEHVIETFRS